MGTSYKQIYLDALQKRSIEQIKKSEEIKLRIYNVLQSEKRLSRKKDFNFFKHVINIIENAERQNNPSR